MNGYVPLRGSQPGACFLSSPPHIWLKSHRRKWEGHSKQRSVKADVIRWIVPSLFLSQYHSRRCIWGENVLCETAMDKRGPFPGATRFCWLDAIVSIHPFIHPFTHPFQHCHKHQDQTQIHLLTEVSNKKLTPCSGTGMTWQLPRTKGTHTAISGLILRQHPGSNRMG